jgi:hypothetical protein
LAALDPLEAWCADIDATLAPEPPVLLAKGGAIAPGVDPELDRPTVKASSSTAMRARKRQSGALSS